MKNDLLTLYCAGAAPDVARRMQHDPSLTWDEAALAQLEADLQRRASPRRPVLIAGAAHHLATFCRRLNGIQPDDHHWSPRQIKCVDKAWRGWPDGALVDVLLQTDMLQAIGDGVLNRFESWSSLARDMTRSRRRRAGSRRSQREVKLIDTRLRRPR